MPDVLIERPTIEEIMLSYIGGTSMLINLVMKDFLLVKNIF